MLSARIAQYKNVGWKPDKVTTTSTWVGTKGAGKPSNVSLCELLTMMFKEAAFRGATRNIKRNCPKGYECCEDQSHRGVEEAARLEAEFKYHDFWGTSRCLVTGTLSVDVKLKGKWGRCVKKGQ